MTKCWLLLHAISDWEGGAGLRLSSNVQQIAEEVLALIPSAMAERGVPTRVLVEILKKLCESLPESDQKPLSAFQTVYNAAEQGRPGTAAARAFKGTFYIRYAWDARGSGWADTVSEEGWKLFHERLAVAATCFEEAWKLDPSDPTAPSGMLTVALGNEGARKDFQLWWKRAIDVEPDDTDAAERVLHVLMPRWLGSPETLLEFGQECFSRAKRENLRPCIALLLLRAHETLLTPGSSIGLTPSEELRLREKYWEQSAVWQDVQKVFSWVLKNHPESEYYRSLYAYYAGRCARWKEAHDQFEQLGDSVAWSAFGGQEQGVLTRRLSRNWRP